MLSYVHCVQLSRPCDASRLPVALSQNWPVAHGLAVRIHEQFLELRQMCIRNMKGTCLQLLAAIANKPALACKIAARLQPCKADLRNGVSVLLLLLFACLPCSS
ncbi:hypothetical protein ABBQ38_013181 [Trebouxia sp. C0009 RCD-2024]